MDIFSKFHTVPVDRFIAVDTSEMKKLGFSYQISYCINVFFDNFGSGRTWKIGTSPEAINLLITLEKA